MARKILKAGGKRKITAKKAVKETENGSVVLVGTYREKQLDWIKKSGVYNYPLAVPSSTVLSPLSATGADKPDYSRIKELWLYAGAKAKRHCFAAEFVGIQSKDEFLAANPTYATKVGKPSHAQYAVFKAKPFDYGPKLEGKIVVARAIDFATGRGQTKKIAAAIRQFHADGEFAPLAAYLPSDLAKVPLRQLRVCEAAVQFDFMQIMFPERRFPAMSPLAYAKGGIGVTTEARTQAPQVFRMGEFFCGPGGLACGALSAKIECDGFRIAHAWANDYDAQTCETYRENICHDEPETVICGDVRKLDLEDKRLTAIDGFAFGFPCNDFSVVGEHKGIDGNYGPLYQYGVAVLKKFKPRWFVAENVGGLASANEGAAFKKILVSMKDAGYRIYPHLYKFEEYGVPQSRHRIIIVGIRSDQPQVFNPPSPALLAPRNNSAKAALENPPIPADAPNNDRTVQHPKVVERLKYIKPGQNAFTAKLPAHLQLNVKGAKISQIYKRLDPNKPAYTVTGSGGGGTHIYHYSEPRALTNRERARLQTFPDAYLFTGSKESVRKQIGMAVPPRGAQIIFEALLRTFAGIEYQHVSCNITEEGELNKGAL